MLVWCKQPGLTIFIPGIHARIYGSLYQYPPRDIPFKYYSIYKDCLIDAPYTNDWFRKHFKALSEDFSFTYAEVKYLPLKYLFMISKAMDIEYKSKGRPSKLYMILEIKRRLRESNGT